MKKLIILLTLILVITVAGCNPVTTTETVITTTNVEITTNTNVTTTIPPTTDFTTIIEEDIYIKLNGGVDTVEINSVWLDAGALIYINDIEYVMTTLDEVNLSVLGIYEIVYYYTYQEEDLSIKRYVIVTDQTKPVLSLNLGIDTVKVNTEWIDMGVSVSDNSLEDLEVIVSGNVDITQIGTYVITYSAIDSSGNQSTVVRYVSVIE